MYFVRVFTLSIDWLLFSALPRSFFPDNCELSDQDSHLVQVGSPIYFEINTQFDFYERDALSPGCLDGES